MEKWREDMERTGGTASGEGPSLGTVLLWSIGLYILTLTALGIAGILSFAYQLWTYLKSGQWMPLSLLDVLKYCKFHWADNPTSWLGVHKILDSLPLWSLTPISAFLWALTLMILVGSDYKR